MQCLAPATRMVEEGDVIDLGDRVFEARVVDAGHDPSFGGRQLRQLARSYLDRRS
jgi:hypothetical protein